MSKVFRITPKRVKRSNGQVEKPTHVDPVRRFHLTLDTIFILTHIAKI